MWCANDAAMWNGSGRLRRTLRGCLRVCADEKTHQGQSSFLCSNELHIPFWPRSISITHPRTHICPPSPFLLKPSRVHGNRATGLHRKYMQINSWLTQSCKLCAETLGRTIIHWRMIPLLNVPQSQPDLNRDLTQTWHRHQPEQEEWWCC